MEMFTKEENAKMAFELGKLHLDLNKVEALGKKLVATVEKVDAARSELIEWRVGAASIVEGFAAINKFVEQRASDDVKDMSRMLLKRAEAVRDMVEMDS